MNTTETGTEGSSSLGSKIDGLRRLIGDRIDATTEFGKAKIADRRDQQRRDELLRELGELHVTAATTPAGSVDTEAADRIIDEISAIDRGNAGDAHEEGDDNGES